MRVLVLFFILLICSCAETTSQQAKDVDRAKLLADLKSLEQKLENDKSAKIDTTLAKQMIEKSIAFVKAFPKDSLSGSYLFRAADVSVGVGEYQLAIDYWEQMQEQYKEHEKAPIALFFQGFTCENNLKDKTKASAYYQAFLSKYPNHQYADQIKLLLEQMDKTDEELIKEFKKRQESNG